MLQSADSFSYPVADTVPPTSCFQNRSSAVCPNKGASQAMSTNSGPVTEVLHSDKHSTLTAEEIAKAVARHNKHHPTTKVENAAPKVNKAGKK